MRIRWGTVALAALMVTVAVPAAVVVAGGGVAGKYVGKIRHGGPVERKIVLKVTRERAKLVELPLDIDCRVVHDERITEVLKGGAGKLKRQFEELGGEINFKIRRRLDHFHDGTLKVEIAAGFRGEKIAGTFAAYLDYGPLGSCSDGGDFRAR